MLLVMVILLCICIVIMFKETMEFLAISDRSDSKRYRMIASICVSFIVAIVTGMLLRLR